MRDAEHLLAGLDVVGLVELQVGGHRGAPEHEHHDRGLQHEQLPGQAPSTRPQRHCTRPGLTYVMNEKALHVTRAPMLSPIDAVVADPPPGEIQ